MISASRTRGVTSVSTVTTITPRWVVSFSIFATLNEDSGSRMTSAKKEEKVNAVYLFFVVFRLTSIVLSYLVNNISLG